MSERRGGRPSSKSQFIDQVREMYLVQKMSLGEIAEQIGKTTATVSSWIKSEGIPLEPRPRNANAGRTPEQQAEINERIKRSIATSQARQERPGGRPREVAREVRVCPVDGIEFEARVDKETEFCSLSCARVGQGREYTARKEREWLASEQSTCACGNKIPYSLRRNTFCSNECAQRYGDIRQRDPSNWATYICQNLSCGQIFERRKNSRNAKLYCSQACADRMTKVKHHIVLRDHDVILDSAWEALFWGAAKFAKLSIERFDRQYRIEWTPGHWYAPDFWMPTVRPWTDRQGVAVEVKGYEDPDDQKKWAAFRATGRDLVVMDSYRMEHLSAHDVANVLRIAALKDNVRVE